MKLYEPFQFLTATECDNIISYAKDKIKPGSTLGKFSGRNNRIAWYEDSQHWGKWIAMFNEIDPVIDWIQTPQIAFYKPGEQYDWHVDTWPDYRTHVRYFTLTCELQSAPEGKLQIQDKDFSLKKGEAIVFRPNDRHRAVSPSQDERISFTIWAMAKNANKVDR